jgi:hypothetical protein
LKASFWGNIKKIYIIIAVAAIVVVTCMFTAILAIKMNEQKNILPTMETANLSANNSTMEIKTPFPLNMDAEFKIDPEIRYYVSNTSAFWGQNDDFALQIYSVTFRTEILANTWKPNLENMANVSISSLQKNILLSNLSHQKKYYNLKNIKAIEATSLYTTKGEKFVQRVLHIPLKDSTWSVKANYRETDNKTHAMVDKIFASVVLTENQK